MPISFSCSQCGKGYLVSDGLAGKKAVCKACNNRMTIPGGPAPAAAPSRPANVPAAAPAARQVSVRPSSPRAVAVPVARTIARPAEPADDIYGINEAPAPLPRMTPRSAVAEDATTAEAPVKKKKKKGFFSSGKKKSSAKSFQYSGSGIGGIRIIAIIIGAIAAGVGGWGLLPKSEVESFHKTLIAQRAELYNALHSIQDAAGAQAAAPRVQEILARMTKHLEDNGFKKGRENDVKEMNARYGMQHQMDVQRLVQEISRVAMIPGAMDALGIQGHMQRLDAVEQRLQREAK